MKVDLGIWDKLSRLVVLLLFLAAVLAVVLWYWPLIEQNERIRHATMVKEQQIRQEEVRAKKYENEIRALLTDPRAVERVAREKLGYIRPGETRIQFEIPSTNAVARP